MGILAALGGPFSVENQAGERLADAHLEAGHETRLYLPLGEPLFYRTGVGEEQFILVGGVQKHIDPAKLSRSGFAARGAISSALERGPSAVPFGPAYYRGFVDRAAELPVISTAGDAQANAASIDRSRQLPRRGRRIAAWTLVGVAASLVSRPA